MPQPLPVEEPVIEDGVSDRGTQEQVQLEVIGSDANVTATDTLFSKDQGAHSNIPEAAPQALAVVSTSVASRANEYLRRRLLAPVIRSTSIQSPMRDHTHLEAEIVEIQASVEVEVEDQRTAATDTVAIGTQLSDPLLVEEEMDIHSRLAVIAE